MKTKVIFKKIIWFDDTEPTTEVNALFPDLSEGKDCILSYAHQGQHSEINEDFLKDGKVYKHFVSTASKEEYLPLYNELLSIGYDLEII